MAATQYDVDFRAHMYVLQINDDEDTFKYNFRKVPRMDVAVEALFVRLRGRSTKSRAFTRRAESEVG